MKASLVFKNIRVPECKVSLIKVKPQIEVLNQIRAFRMVHL